MYSWRHRLENIVQRQERVWSFGGSGVNEDNFYWDLQPSREGILERKVQELVYKKESGVNGAVREKWLLRVQISRCTAIITHFKARLDQKGFIGPQEIPE